MTNSPKFPSKIAANAIRSAGLFASRSMQLEYEPFTLATKLLNANIFHTA